MTPLASLLVLAVSSGLAAADLSSDLNGAGITALFPGSDGYSEASQAYNRRFTVSPAAVAFPSSAEEVSTIVQAGAANNMQIVPRGGGHSYIANGLGGKDGALVVDMSNMKAIDIDSNSNTVVIESGNRLGDVALTLNDAGRALPHGTCPYVGIGGHSAFGGYGFTSRQWGLALDPIFAINAVLANGTIVRATEDSTPDLFWALRGAAPSFAITTSIELNTFAAPSYAIVFQYNWQLDYDAAAEGLLAFQDFSLSGPPATFGAEINLGRGNSRGTVSFGLVGGWYGEQSGLDAALEPFLSRMPEPSSHQLLGDGTYINTVSQLAGSNVNTSQAADHTDTFYAKSLMTPMGEPVSLDAFTAFTKYLAEEGFDSETSWFMQVEQYGGPNSKINEVGVDETSFFHRDVLFTWQLYASSSNAQPPYPEDGFTFVDGVANAVTSNMPDDWSYGAYPNYIDDRLENWETLYFGAHYSRLQSIKNEVDPSNIFMFPTSIQEGS